MVAHDRLLPSAAADVEQSSGPTVSQQTKPWQTRSVCMYPDATGFAIGSIEGRVGIHYIDHREGK